MSKYLLTCSCGNTVPVEVGQAGGSVVCSCGTRLEVPTLRMLRHLPPATDQAAKASAPWNARKGVVVAFLAFAALAAASALWSRLGEITLPPFDPTAHQESVEHGLTTMTPVQGWHVWTEVYRPLAVKGFTVFEHPQAAAVNQQLTERRFFQKMMLIVAGTCVAVAATVALWPSAAPRR